MDIEFPSSQLRYLHFNGNNLVELDLIWSSIKQLWKGNEVLLLMLLSNNFDMNFKVHAKLSIKTFYFVLDSWQLDSHQP